MNEHADSVATQSERDTRYMRRALELAARGLYTTDPNPRVGCVLVRDGRVLGEGWHQRAGEAHAEVHALAAAGESARGATAYVTLEPCAHTGRTAPCVRALIGAGVGRVVYAVGDPNPLVNGAGVAALRAAGIDTAGELLAAEARALNPGFFKRMRTGLPWVRVKLGASLDGRTALANGASRWITAPAARQDAQRFRARSSVVLSGSGTVLADDPALNVRVEGATRQPLRVLLDSELRVPPTARMFDREGPALVFTASEDGARRAEFERRGVRVESAARAVQGGLELEPVLRRLAQLEANEIWVEAGARLAGALLQSRLVDEFIVYLAPSLLGPTARALVELPEISQLEQRMRLEFSECKPVGPDLRLTAVPVAPAAPV
ncbi:MAG TPA: bifunctional diaminohydroxyphosphoribosylaminopyrimidine deaminase/5-amino-6-(5-phosphoribosylamino)uracil reductase RibD [Steroidobacteraceae bacterium]|jgi:diaminohydroxyphosphoribosylaminopyrimidine deaminase/5-amino-6-(5-phosphoribosylamino)uracil reductase|nr:bifunctional diaminohydroxyphosphoribosylaminopyrimidine deaminase/5-amino-6-(5-phosphoribosylamino)uracil reductase RibD [Steroidobacteraceae bacterium]